MHFIVVKYTTTFRALMDDVLEKTGYGNIRAVYTRENKPRITQSAA